MNTLNLKHKPKIVFIVGCPRSGTTYLQKLLSSFENVYSGQESDLIDQYLGPVLRGWNTTLNQNPEARSAVGLSCYLKEVEFHTLFYNFAQGIIDKMFENYSFDDKSIFIEKTPSHALYINEINELFPEAKIINVIRNPKDTCLSLVNASKGWGKHWAPKNLDKASSMWLSHIKAVENAKNTKVLNVKYEELVSSPFETINDIFKYIKVSYTEKEIEYSIAKNSKNNSKKNQDKLKNYFFRLD